MVEHVHRADLFLGVVAQDPLPGGVGVAQGAVRLHYGNDLRGVLHHRAQPPVVFLRLTGRMRGPIGTAMGGTATEVDSLPIRGVHVTFSLLAPLPGPSIQPGPGEGLPQRPARPDLTVGLEAFYDHLPLGLVLPEVTEESLLLRVVLSNSLQASLYPTLYVPLVESQTEVEDLPIVAVVVPDSCPAGETLFPSPTG